MSTSENLPANLNQNLLSDKQFIACHQNKHCMGGIVDVWRQLVLIESGLPHILFDKIPVLLSRTFPGLFVKFPGIFMFKNLRNVPV